jgi:hypothetical protein
MMFSLRDYQTKNGLFKSCSTHAHVLNTVEAPTAESQAMQFFASKV